MIHSRRWKLALAMSVLALGTACSPRRINDVLADPARYRDKEVTVGGRVEQSISVLGRGAYRIDDGDASLWVITTRGAPREGARVEVTGRVQDGFDLGILGGAIKLPDSVRSGVVLMETSHKARD
jgi:hypothetical protein